MRWPWQRRAQRDDLPDVRGDHAAAEAALRDAEKRKAEVEARWPTIKWMAETLDAHRRENGFAEMFNEAMRRRK